MLPLVEDEAACGWMGLLWLHHVGSAGTGASTSQVEVGVALGWEGWGDRGGPRGNYLYGHNFQAQIPTRTMGG